MNRSTVETAVALHNAGWPIIPVGVETPTGSWNPKSPGVLKGWQTRRWTAQELETALTDDPRRGIGVRLDGKFIDIEVDAQPEVSYEDDPVVSQLRSLGTRAWNSSRGEHFLFSISDEQREHFGKLPAVVKETHEGYTVEYRLGCSSVLQSVLPPSDGREWANENDPQLLPDSLCDVIRSAAKPESSEIEHKIEECRQRLLAVGRSVQGEDGSGAIMRAYRTIQRFGLVGIEGHKLAEWYATEMSDPPWQKHGTQGWQRKWTQTLKTAEEVGDVGTEGISMFTVIENTGPAVDEEQDDEKLEEIEQIPVPVLDSICYENLFGRYAKFLDEVVQSEVDPSAVMFQALEIFGGVLGRDAYMQLRDSRLYLNGYLVVVGDRASGRKDTAWQAAKALFRAGDMFTDDEPAAKRFEEALHGGVGSGEALVKELYTKSQIPFGPGEECARMIMKYGELSSLLQKLKIDNSTLMARLNDGWDGTALNYSVSTQKSIFVAKPYLSIVGHIQPEPFRREVTRDMEEGGFLSRWLVVRSERVRLQSDCVQEGVVGRDVQSELDQYRTAVNDAVLWAICGPRRLFPTQEAADMLNSIYGVDTVGSEGRRHRIAQKLAGRLAILRKCDKVEIEDATSAVRMVEYASACRRLFLHGTDTQSFSMTQRVAAYIKTSGRDGRTKQQLRKEVFKDRKASDCDPILNRLLYDGVITEETVRRVQGRGRPTTVYKYAGVNR